LQDRIRGDESEKKVFDALKKLTIGGIVIGGFRMSDITGDIPNYEMGENGRRDESFDRRLPKDDEIYQRIDKGSFLRVSKLTRS
jgi:hypothetical protein